MIGCVQLLQSLLVQAVGARAVGEAGTDPSSSGQYRLPLRTQLSDSQLNKIAQVFRPFDLVGGVGLAPDPRLEVEAVPFLLLRTANGVGEPEAHTLQ